MKKKIRDLLKEMIPVILGILIAFFINNWNERSKDKQFIKLAMESISKELNENQEGLTKIIVEHQELSDTIAYYKENEETTLGEIIGKVRGVRGVNIKNTAWKTFLNSRIDLIDYDKVSTLSSIDENTDNIKIKFEKLTELIYERANSADYISKELLQMTVNDLLYQEENLLESYQEFKKNK